MTSHESTQSMYDAIRSIALRGIVDSRTGTIKNMGQVSGYVAKIHTEGELAGTIDVQEFDNQPFEGEEDKHIGYHEGVYLSALQDSSSGMVIVPKLYSEVTISRDPVSNTEYVSMFSHVDVIQLDSHDTVTVGVSEREEFDLDDEEGPDIEELPLTGYSSKTTYTKDGITSEVHTKDDEHYSKQEMLAESIKHAIGGDKSVLTLDESQIKAEHDNSRVTLNGSNAQMSFGNSSVTVQDGTVSVGSTSGTSSAVLYEELADLLSKLLNYIGQIKTTTQIGLQPPVNVGSFLSLKGDIAKFRSQHVKIQK